MAHLSGMSNDEAHATVRFTRYDEHMSVLGYAKDAGDLIYHYDRSMRFIGYARMEDGVLRDTTSTPMSWATNLGCQAICKRRWPMIRKISDKPHPMRLALPIPPLLAKVATIPSSQQRPLTHLRHIEGVFIHRVRLVWIGEDHTGATTNHHEDRLGRLSRQRR